jgi:oligopeptide transport system permease protein
MIEKILDLGRFFPLVWMGLLFSALGLNLTDYEIPSLLIYVLLYSALFGFGVFVVRQNLLMYTCKRLVEAVIVLFVIASLTFALLRVVPGGPFDQDKALPPDIKANIERKYNLDKPILIQYKNYILNVLQGDLGESYKYLGRPVTEIISESFPASFLLGFYALLFSFLVGIPLGLFAASRHNQFADNASMIVAISGVSLPNFLVAALMVQIFAMNLKWLPPAGWGSVAYYILPVVCLGMRPIAFIARLTRSSVLDVIGSDYIRTAKAKGLSHQTVMYKHVLKNSLIPVLTYSGPLVAAILTGSFVIEIFFAIPGIGKHLVQSVTNRDYPFILALTLLYAALLVFSNLIVDLLYAFFDPRIRLT